MLKCNFLIYSGFLEFSYKFIVTPISYFQYVYYILFILLIKSAMNRKTRNMIMYQDNVISSQ